MRTSSAELATDTTAQRPYESKCPQVIGLATRDRSHTFQKPCGSWHCPRCHAAQLDEWTGYLDAVWGGRSVWTCVADPSQWEACRKYVARHHGQFVSVRMDSGASLLLADVDVSPRQSNATRPGATEIHGSDASYLFRLAMTSGDFGRYPVTHSHGFAPPPPYIRGGTGARSLGVLPPDKSAIDVNRAIADVIAALDVAVDDVPDDDPFWKEVDRQAMGELWAEYSNARDGIGP